MIKTILAPIDGSPAAFSAFQYSLKVAKLLDADVEVLFVVDQRKTQVPFMYAGGAYDITYERIYIPPDQELRDFYDRIKNDLHEFAKRCIKECLEMAQNQNIEMSSEVVEGYPADAIQKQALGVDLVVMGQHGENAGTKQETIGSTTEELVRKSPRPVIVCPEKFSSPEKVLFPYDGSRSAESCLQFYTGHLSHKIPNLLFLCAECKEDSEPYQNEIEYLNQHSVQVKLLQQADEPIQAIDRIVEQEKPDLIMMGSHGRNKFVAYLLGSTTIHVIRKSNLPVLIVY